MADDATFAAHAEQARRQQQQWGGGGPLPPSTLDSLMSALDTPSDRLRKTYGMNLRQVEADLGRKRIAMEDVKKKGIHITPSLLAQIAELESYSKWLRAQPAQQAQQQQQQQQQVQQQPRPWQAGGRGQQAPQQAGAGPADRSKSWLGQVGGLAQP